MKYPDYLSPLADSYTDVQDFTVPAIIYTYDLFIETQIKNKKLSRPRKQTTLTINPDTLGTSKEDNLLRFILQDQITVPYNLHLAPIPAEKFAHRFLEEIHNQYPLTTKKGTITPELNAITSKNLPITTTQPEILGYETPPHWLYYYLQSITENNTIYYSTTPNPNTNTPETTIVYEGNTRAIQKARSKKEIDTDDHKQFRQHLEQGKLSTYIEHYPIKSTQYRDTLPKTKLTSMGTAFLAAATGGNLLAYSITPELGILTSALTGGVIATTSITTLLWNKWNKDVGEIKLTKAGQRLLKEYQAYYKYKNLNTRNLESEI